MNRVARFLALFVAVALVAVACNAPRQSATDTGSPAPSATPNFTGQSVNIVTGGQGGVYIIYGAGLADLLTKQLKVNASAESTAASVANMQLIRDGKAQLAFTLADTAYDAVQGRTTSFEGKKADAKALAVLYSNYTHVIAKDGSGIKTIADLKGKRVSVGAANSGTEVIANRILEAYGIDPGKDLSRERLGVADSADRLKSGGLDAFFWSGGLPTSQITDLVNSTKIVFVEHTDSIKKMSDKYGPFYFNATIPKNTYKNDADIAVAGVANLLVAPSSLDPALVKAILTTMFDNKSTLETVHAEAKNLKLETATKGSPLEFHPGAIDFYKFKGVWNP
ncbi:MAG: TAXI family TRAP transporter solute-binding subunit [Chloroflexi bacterium]|nr:MAG: TAXI family TRAP transporter solute-binding subunit [Chloroflexota bacterium]